ncbi:MAG: hypothetical protein [Microviridae sp.]|nr:MAG: hypothetical protein [Microviridae sp.]
MAKRVFKAQLRPCKCNLCADIDKLQTKGGLAITPANVKQLTDRGIAVNLPNANGFFTSEGKSDWFVEPQFRRDATMCSLWEQEQESKSKVISAHKRDKQKFG